MRSEDQVSIQRVKTSSVHTLTCSVHVLSLSLYIYICVRVYVHMLWLCLKTIEIYTVTLNLNWLKHSIPNKMLDFQIPDVPSGKSESDPALNLGSHENYSHIDGFIDGFWLVVDLPL